jgi:hypothetical protein
MKHFNLNAYGVEEMTTQEMQLIDGGNIFKKIGEAIEAAAEWVGQAAQDVWEFMTDHDRGVTKGPTGNVEYGGAKL